MITYLNTMNSFTKRVSSSRFYSFLLHTAFQHSFNMKTYKRKQHGHRDTETQENSLSFERLFEGTTYMTSNKKWDSIVLSRKNNKVISWLVELSGGLEHNCTNTKNEKDQQADPWCHPNS
ncbi:hypothetical protein K501DRAFT_273202 [Backusella circina FSU 941]|nr:hypothetical protein K501DRAFT_273202 [Backusella circina FSU 941]